MHMARGKGGGLAVSFYNSLNINSETVGGTAKKQTLVYTYIYIYILYIFPLNLTIWIF